MLWLCVVGVVCASRTVYANSLGQVISSSILFRHGERMPLEFYPNDPHKNSPKWHFGVAQLTDVGCRQEYNLGQWLRQRYSNLLADHYRPTEVFMVSTDTDRTLMSAQCCAAGLYPETSVPVPVHTTPVLDDKLLGATATCPCPSYTVEMNRVAGLPEVEALQDKFKHMYDYISMHAGYQVRDFSAAIKIYDVLSIEEQQNMSLPAWTQAIYPEPVREAGLYSFVLPTLTTQLQRLKIGPLVKDMVQHLQDKAGGKQDVKVRLYSAHDATLAAFLHSLGAFNIHFPPYAACIGLELRLVSGKYFVTMWYRNSTEEPHLLPVLSCDLLCPLERFVSLVQPLVPDNWVRECRLPPTTQGLYSWSTVALVSLDIAFISCIVLVLLFVKCSFKKRPRKTGSKKYLTMNSPSISTHSSKNVTSLEDPKFVYIK